MKEQAIYIDEISGRRFDKREDAVKSEENNKAIRKMFSFWQNFPKDATCDFANGGWCYERGEINYWRYVDTLISAIKLYEPWVYKQYKGGLLREHVNSGYSIGRYLGDGDSVLYAKLCVINNSNAHFKEWEKDGGRDKNA